MMLVPLLMRCQPAWSALAARIAYRAGAPNACLEVLGTDENLLAFKAWVMLEQGSSAAALHLAESTLTSAHADVAWRVVASARATLHHPDWRATFAGSLTHLHGRQRGLCLIEYGYYLTMADDNAAARSAYAEALPLLSNDRYFLALLHYNIAIACHRLGQMSHAMHAAKASVEAADHPEATLFIPRAWSGLGLIQRSRLELPRAQHAYGQAKMRSTETDDLVQAWRGHAAVTRLEGKLDNALALLFEALQFDPLHVGTLTDIALVKTQLGDHRGALEVIAALPTNLPAEETQRLALVRLELRRVAGEIEAVRAALVSLDWRGSWVSEERRHFAELFGLKGERAAPLEPMRVTVITDGTVRVCIGDHPLPATPPRLAALLTCLIHHDQRVPKRQLTDSLTLRGGTPRQREQSLSRAVAQLREYLGWDGAITVQNGEYVLDHRVQWRLEYPSDPERFCAALTDPWISDWREAHLEPLVF
jgi:tetratricopeptide (TPR) repeat protein